MRFWACGTIILLLTVTFISCQSGWTSEDVAGLWTLEELWIDGRIEPENDHFLELKADGTFAVAQRSGDTRGIYYFKGQKIFFESPDRKWFHVPWKLIAGNDQLILTGKGDYNHIISESGNPIGLLNTKLVFSRASEIPDYQGFEDSIAGKWQLYKIRSNGNPVNIDSTHFILEQGQYRISGEDGINESGRVIINTRYQKLFFEGQETSWDVRFYGPELRLSNKELGLEYALKR